MTTTAPAVDPVEYVKALPIESRERVFFSLLREVLTANDGCNFIPLRDEEIDYGTLVTPTAPAVVRGSPEYEKLLAELDPEVAERIRQPLPDDFDADNVMTEEQLKEIEDRIEAEFRG